MIHLDHHEIHENQRSALEMLKAESCLLLSLKKSITDIWKGSKGATATDYSVSQTPLLSRESMNDYVYQNNNILSQIRIPRKF